MRGIQSSEGWKLIKTLRLENTEKINIPKISANKLKDYYRQELREDRTQYRNFSPTAYRAQGTQVTVGPEIIEKAMKN